MKFLSEFRDPALIRSLLLEVNSKVTRAWKIMEVCGGQTHSIIKSGIDKLLDPRIELLHGPGCPVCVTPLQDIEVAFKLAQSKEIIFCSYGDMLRVPGKSENLLMLKSKGAKVELVYSPLDALTLAQNHPNQEVVFWSVGFETTAPATALAVLRARERGLNNFSVLVSHVQVPPAMELLVADPASQISAFLAAGHVCTITGDVEYRAFVEKHKIPVVITGFEPTDILQGILSAVECLESSKPQMINQYTRVAHSGGNKFAQVAVGSVFEVSHQYWRGIGMISDSGLKLRKDFSDFCAQKKFAHFENKNTKEACSELCQSGLLMQGKIKPPQCPEFGKTCTPESPLGAPMVSTEGACSAYFQNRRLIQEEVLNYV